ncbi:hypothetical protein F511_14088 [Dorcoceras hygrometricum]|uniref:Uncharacterized protein n=1 Tax=Dorcoceras hygrometricum TaxID=472368 RepID=A0A2Z7BM90_9LAMI|nr:hypothetical protein F511_14088 [Dorcoceras hygrometricum]
MLRSQCATRRTSSRERAATGRSSLGLHCATSSATSCAKQRPMGRPPACIDRNMMHLATTSFTRKPALQAVGGGRLRRIKSTTGSKVPSSACTRRPEEISTDGNSSSLWPEQVRRGKAAAAARGKHGGGVRLGEEGGGREFPCGNLESSTCVTLNGSGIQLAMGPQPLWLRNDNFGHAHRIMVKRLATSPHDPLGITDIACKNQLVVVRVQYGPFNQYIPIRSTTIGKSRVVIDPIAMHTSWRSNSDITNNIGYPRMSASGKSSTTMHRLLHASGPHPIPPPNDPQGVEKRVKVRRLSRRVSMMFRVVRTNQYNQDLGLIHSTNGNHLESPNEGSSIDHQVTIHLHAQNITMFPTNETWYFASQMLVSSSGGLILVLTAQ